MTGSAEAASQAIEAWLQGREPQEEAMALALLETRRMVKRLSEAALVRNDSLARAMLNAVARAEGMEEMVAALDRLDERVHALLGEAGETETKLRAPRMLLRL